MRVSRFFSVNAQCVVAADRTVLSCSCLTVGAARKRVASEARSPLALPRTTSRSGGTKDLSDMSLEIELWWGLRVAGHVIICGAQPALRLQRQRRGGTCRCRRCSWRRRRRRRRRRPIRRIKGLPCRSGRGNVIICGAQLALRLERQRSGGTCS